MKVLVLAVAYPKLNGERPSYYIHSRNLYYVRGGISVTVLNFASSSSYTIDGIKVISLSDYAKSEEQYDMVISHASNLRNQYKFFLKYGRRFKKKVFIFHGSEILHINKYYPKPFSFAKKNTLPPPLQDLYDDLKIKLWKNYYIKNIENIRLVFVSNWLFKQFQTEFKVNNNELKSHAEVISNSVGSYFELNRYQEQKKNSEFDFISIRSYLDVAKYGADIVVRIAKDNPEYKFLLIGKGVFFEHFEKPKNLTWICEEMSHEKLCEYIQKSKYALLPTREDTQGLMACELATYGIPLITSDIEVCREVFDGCQFAYLIDNNNPRVDEAIKAFEKRDLSTRWDKYLAAKTIEKEMEYIKAYYEE